MNRIHCFLLASCALFLLLSAGRTEGDPLPPIPQPATSFGAAISDGWLYVYGGNTGKAHEFNKECVKGDFFRLRMPRARRGRNYLAASRC